MSAGGAKKTLNRLSRRLPVIHSEQRNGPSAQTWSEQNTQTYRDICIYTRTHSNTDSGLMYYLCIWIAYKFPSISTAEFSLKLTCDHICESCISETGQISIIVLINSVCFNYTITSFIHLSSINPVCVSSFFASSLF